MAVVWPGLEKWPEMYHFFHHLNNTNRIPKFLNGICWWITFFELALCVSQVRLTHKSGVVAAFLTSINSLIDAVLYFSWIPYEYLAPILTGISICFVVFTVVVYKNHFLLMQSTVTFLMRLCLQCLTPLFTLISSSVLQSLIENAAEKKSFDILIVIMLVGCIIFTTLMLMTGLMFGQPLAPLSLTFSAWSYQLHTIYIAMACVIQQTWSCTVISIYGGFVPLALAFAMGVGGFFYSMVLPFISPDANTWHIAFMLCVTALSAVSAVVLVRPEYCFEMAFTFLGVAFLIGIFSSYIYAWIGDRILRAFYADIRNDQMDQETEGSESSVGIKGMNSSRNVRVLHYLLISGYNEVGEVAMRVVENSGNPDVIVECFRILVLVRAVPSAVWPKILELGGTDVSFWKRPLLCELHYEAIRVEQDEEVYKGFGESLNETKTSIKGALLRLESALQAKSALGVQSALDEYVLLCEEYETEAGTYLNNSRKSKELLKSYYDFLVHVRADYIGASAYKQQIDALEGDELANGATKAAGDAPPDGGPELVQTKTSDEITPQQVVNQQVVSKFTSLVFPKAIAVLVVLCLCRLVGVCLRGRYLFRSDVLLIEHNTAVFTFLSFLNDMYSYEMKAMVRAILLDDTVDDVLRDRLSELPLPGEMAKNVSPAIDLYLDEISGRDSGADTAVNRWFNEDVSAEIDVCPAFAVASVHHELWVLDSEGVDGIGSDTWSKLRPFISGTSRSQSEMMAMLGEHVSSLHDSAVLSLGIYSACLCLGIVGSATCLLVLCIVYIYREYNLFIGVMFKVHDGGLNQCRRGCGRARSSSLIQQVSVDEDDVDDLQDGLLELEEIELDDDDPIVLPTGLSEELYLRDRAEIDGSNLKTRELGKFDIRKPRGLAMAVIILLVIDVLLIMSCIFYGNVMAHSESVTMLDDKVEQMESLRVMIENVGTMVASLLSDDIKWTEPSDCSKVTTYMEECESLRSAQERWDGKEIDDALVVVIEEACIRGYVLIPSILLLGDDYLAPISKMYNIIWAVACSGQVLIAIIMVTIFILYLRHARFVFDALRRVLLLMQPQYFSLMTADPDLFYLRDTGSVEKNDLVAAPARIVKHSSGATVYINTDMQIIEVGQATLAVFAYRKEELVGLHISSILPDFMNIAQFEEEEIKEFDITGVRSDKTPLQLRCSFLSREVSILILVDLTAQTNTRNRIRENKAKLFTLLKRMMPTPLAERYIAGENNIAVRKDEVVFGAITMVEFGGRATHDHMMDVVDVLYTECDRRIREYPTLCRIAMDRGSYRFVGGLFKDMSMEDAVYDAFMFAKGVQLKVNADVARFMGGSARFQSCLYISGPVVGNVLRRNVPIFDMWCAENDKLRKIIFGMKNDRVMRVTEDVKDYLEGRGISAVPEIQSISAIPTFIVPVLTYEDGE